MPRPAASGPLRAVAGIVSGSVVGQGLVILAYPLLTRLYTPADFWLLAVFAALIGPVAAASTGGLDAAVAIPGQDRAASTVAFLSLVFVIATSAVVGVLAWSAAPLAVLLGLPALGGLWWLLALTVLATGTYTVLSQWMIRCETYRALGRRNVFQGVGQAGTQIGLGLAGVVPLGLLLGLGVGRLTGLGGLVSRHGLLRQPLPTLPAVRAALTRFRRFPLLAMPSRVVNSAGLDVPLLVLSALYADPRVGLLGLTVRVLGAPSTVLGQAVLQVFTGRSSAALRRAEGTFGATVRSAVRRLLLVGTVPALVLCVAGPWLFGVVFGAAWTEAGEYARYLAPAYLLQLAVVPVSGTLLLLERQHRDLAWSTLRLLLTVGAPTACALLGAPIASAVLALGIAHVIGYGVLYALSVRAADVSDAVARRP